jgi:hypothetical protein
LQIKLRFSLFGLEDGLLLIFGLLAAHLLELSHHGLELIESPVVEIFPVGFGLDDVLLKLLRIVVLLDNLQVEILLLFILAIIHVLYQNYRFIPTPYQIQKLDQTEAPINRSLRKGPPHLGHFSVLDTQNWQILWQPQEVITR